MLVSVPFPDMTSQEAPAVPALAGRCGSRSLERRHPMQVELGWRVKHGTVPDHWLLPLLPHGSAVAECVRDRALLVGNAAGCLPFGGHGAPLAWSATGRQNPGSLANFPCVQRRQEAAEPARIPQREGKFWASGPPGVAFPALRGALR